MIPTYVLLSAETFAARRRRAVGLSGQNAESGPIASTRLGLETEIIAHLRLRASSNYESSGT